MTDPETTRHGGDPDGELPRMDEVDRAEEVHRPTEPDEQDVLERLYGPADGDGVYSGPPRTGQAGDAAAGAAP